MSWDGSANLVEVFSSIQGEGPWLGCSTLFVRFGRCDLRCSWCDSPHTWKPAARCRLHPAGDRPAREIDNPLALGRLVEEIEAYAPERHRFVSLTGGEPLLQPEAVAALAEALRPRGPRILLETHGLASEALGRVVGQVDVVSMDWKLASEVRREGTARRDAAPFDAEHTAFLRVAREAPEVVVKVVVTPSTLDAELDAMAKAVAGVDPELTVVLQPVTPFGRVRGRVAPDRLVAWQERLERRLRDVRVIPQTHRQLDVP